MSCDATVSKKNREKRGKKKTYIDIDFNQKITPLDSTFAPLPHTRTPRRLDLTPSKISEMARVNVP